VLARNAERAVGLRAVAEDDLVVVAAQVVEGDILAEFDVAEETRLRAHGDLVVERGDGLDLRMIGRHPGPHQPERRRRGVEEIGAHRPLAVLDQVLDRVEASGTGPDHGDTQRARRRGARVSVDGGLAHR
jgi:hypothetical protein